MKFIIGVKNLENIKSDVASRGPPKRWLRSQIGIYCWKCPKNNFTLRRGGAIWKTSLQIKVTHYNKYEV